MNRHNRRANESRARKVAPIATGLLQKRYAELEANYAQMRNVLFAVAKEQGRLRFRKATLDSLNNDDHLDAKDEGEFYVISFVESDMVVPGGVQPKEAG